MSKNQRHNTSGTRGSIPYGKATDKRSERNRILRTKAKLKMQKGEFVDLPEKPRERNYWWPD